MITSIKNQIKREDLTVMEELAHQCQFRVNELEAICAAHVYSITYDVEFEVYPPGESYPSYFNIHYYLFTELLDTWYSDNNIDACLTDFDGNKLKNDEGGSITPIYWYDNLATEKDQLEVTNYVINQLFNQLF